jgi:hypothetical protein
VFTTDRKWRLSSCSACKSNALTPLEEEDDDDDTIVVAAAELIMCSTDLETFSCDRAAFSCGKLLWAKEKAATPVVVAAKEL